MTKTVQFIRLCGRLDCDCIIEFNLYSIFFLDNRISIKFNCFNTCLINPSNEASITQHNTLWPFENDYSNLYDLIKSLKKSTLNLQTDDNIHFNRSCIHDLTTSPLNIYEQLICFKLPMSRPRILAITCFIWPILTVYTLA